MLCSEGFRKFAGIPTCMLRICGSLMTQQISANRRKNRSIQVLYRAFQGIPSQPKKFGGGFRTTAAYMSKPGMVTMG